MQRQPAAALEVGVPLHENLEKDAAAYTILKQCFRCIFVRFEALFWRELHNPIILMK